MLLVLVVTNKGSQIKILQYQIFGKFRKQGCFFYERIYYLLIQKNGNTNLCVKYEKYT